MYSLLLLVRSGYLEKRQPRRVVSVSEQAGTQGCYSRIEQQQTFFALVLRCFPDLHVRIVALITALFPMHFSKLENLSLVCLTLPGLKIQSSTSSHLVEVLRNRARQNPPRSFFE